MFETKNKNNVSEHMYISKNLYVYFPQKKLLKTVKFLNILLEK